MAILGLCDAPMAREGGWCRGMPAWLISGVSLFQPGPSAVLTTVLPRTRSVGTAV